MAVQSEAPQLTQEQVGSVFHMAFGGAMGTGFLWGDQRGSFFVTAKHLVADAEAGDKIHLITRGGAIVLTIQEIQKAPKGLDVAVFSAVDFQVGGQARYYIEYGIALGQRVLFLGFPHGLQSNYPAEQGFVSPLVRSAFFSGIVKFPDGIETIYLDGFNNPGYSGGPVYTLGDDKSPALFGIISGYRYEISSVGQLYKLNLQGEEEVVSGHYVKGNSGMIAVVRGHDMLDLAKTLSSRNPVIVPTQDAAGKSGE